MIVDEGGIYGSFLSYGLTIAVVASAFLIFLRLWYRGRLDLDEEPKFKMLTDEIEESHE